ncbi:MAG: 23S rRNA (guanosine(2251)-2'-O)-methyltransferase RlmB [Clostridia bacterium]|nr:23S rRNA (guanosine(2251)-2'-O)-methyltransferase RlmB [Clostridia bacterium]
MNEQNERHSEEIIAGRNPVTEALRSGRAIDHVLIAKDTEGGPLLRIRALCRERDIVVKDTARARLDALCGGLNHQGVAAVAAAHEYASLEDILDAAQRRGEPPFLVIADEISDPQNLGAIIRTAEAAGAHGVIVPKRGGAGLTAIVAKASAGALEYLPVARVSNLVSTVEELKKRGVWIYGADMGGRPVFETDLSGAAAIVVGSEGAGISRLLREKCDFLISLPMKGHITSLNASVACGIILYEAVRCRENKGKATK